MLPMLDELRMFTPPSILVRVVLAVLCGGLIGIERTVKRRAAGFRTHILICLGAAITILTSQFMLLEQNYYTDVARLGAQVVAGVGFIGAGTIIVTRRQKVHGLTTAAGLWGAGVVGLALGAGFYEGGVLTTLLILISEGVLAKFEYWMIDREPEMNLYVEYSGKNGLDSILGLCSDLDLHLLDMEILGHIGPEKKTSAVFLELRLNKHMTDKDVVRDIKKISGVEAVTEL